MNRIKELRQANDVKQATLAEAINVSRAALSGYETGKYEADIDTYMEIADFFNVSLDYLLGADGSPDVVRIPVLGRVPAGIPLEAIEEIMDWEEIPRAMLSGGREYFALQVRGDSMYPEYLDGDVVIVQKTPDFKSGEVCVVYVDGYDATLKQIKIGEDLSLTLQPRNPAYPPRTYTRAEVEQLPVVICGVVVEMRRKVGRRNA